MLKWEQGNPKIQQQWRHADNGPAPSPKPIHPVLSSAQTVQGNKGQTFY